MTFSDLTQRVNLVDGLGDGEQKKLVPGFNSVLTTKQWSDSLISFGSYLIFVIFSIQKSAFIAKKKKLLENSVNHNQAD